MNGGGINRGITVVNNNLANYRVTCSLFLRNGGPAVVRVRSSLVTTGKVYLTGADFLHSYFGAGGIPICLRASIYRVLGSNIVMGSGGNGRFGVSTSDIVVSINCGPTPVTGGSNGMRVVNSTSAINGLHAIV